MFNAIGRFLKRLWKKFKKAAKKTAKGMSKKSKKSSKTDAPAVKETAGFLAFKLVTLTIIACGVFYSGFAATPVGMPVSAALGGEIARTANEIWST
jgi:F0F1-type ATP synthase assembly protein I